MAKSRTSYRKAIHVNVRTDKHIQNGQWCTGKNGDLSRVLYTRAYDGKRICLQKNAGTRFLKLKKLAPQVMEFLTDPNATAMVIDSMTDEKQKERLRIAARNIELHLEGYDG
jgi:hypothetical protein